MKFYLQFLCVTGCWKRSNDTPKLNIHKYTNDNMMKIYINRLSTTVLIFFITSVSDGKFDKSMGVRKRTD